MAEETQRIQVLLDLEAAAHDAAVRRSAREVARLEKAYDPASAALIKFERTQKALATAVERGTITQERQQQLLSRARAQYETTTAAIQRNTVAVVANNNAASGAVAVFRRNGAMLQQVGFQVGDFASQVAGGTSAFVAFGQQGSQLLGMFGAFGALAGAAVAIAAPLAMAWFDAGDEAKKTTDAVDDLTNALDAFVQASEAVRDTDFRSFGALAAQAREAFALRERLAEVKATRAQAAAINALIGEYDRFAGVVALTNAEMERQVEAFLNYDPALRGARAARGDFVALGMAVKEVGDQLGVAVPEAFDFVRAMRDAANATDVIDRSEALARARDALEAAAGHGTDLNEELLGALTSLLDAEIASLGLGANLSGAADQAARLADALDRFESITPLGPQFADEDAVMAQQVLPDAGMREGQSRALQNFIRLTTTRKRSGRARVDPDLAEAQRLYRSTRTEAQKYAAEVERINDLHRKFPEIVTTEVRDRALAALSEGANDLLKEFGRLDETLASTFSGIIRGANSAGDAIGRLLDRFADLLLQEAFRGIFGGIGLGGLFGGLFGSAKGNVFAGGNVIPFADGGVISAPSVFPMRDGRTGLMGEAGPEAIMPLRRIGGRLGVEATPSVVEVYLRDDMLDGRIVRGAGRVVQAAAPAIRDEAVATVRRASLDSKRALGVR